MLNNIEYNVGASLTYAKEGVGQLAQANEYARKSRKKMCYLIVFFTIVALVVVKPWNL
eukprot:COSAG05_NODE_661_length_8043_cov_22.502014_8_plen_58_part_00